MTPVRSRCLCRHRPFTSIVDHRSVSAANALDLEESSGERLDDSLLANALVELRRDAIELEQSCRAALDAVPAADRPSVRNLLHYLALRRHDVRHLQRELARGGLSSLGRAEAHVLATLDAVLARLGVVASTDASTGP